MLFIFIAIVCFSAVIVIAYTRSQTIAMTHAQVYDDLCLLGAKNSYLYTILKKQISQVYFTPIFAGTVMIYALYMAIMFFNDGGSFSHSEIAGLGSCLLVIAGIASSKILEVRVERMAAHFICLS